MSEGREIGTELLIDLAEQIGALARSSFGVSPARAAEFGQDAAAMLADHWGGQHVYIPKDVATRQRERYHQIYSEFTGSNQHDLARKYGLSVQHVYRILRRVRDERRQRQYSLI
ncbi:MAG: hypothetical protein KUA35_10400 [Pseudodesulfovibrio sp.]|uniref:Mor transcription activator domain protein n=1 Tax=Pseudodesulfovibrio aespoeensis (strain ATCC 700646 / DSM 10631 / Aspo-2) TaxID=643562 RepID=E6VUD4_PSEA9|nr:MULTISPECIES: Mor transcription activator family protein [Pseudodesulfovibrio]MBU4192242.1 DNA-binding protein [Pseudomonadota bacterium]ADU63441.1 Mor transcription activator domain protein [Pseudodesulfovibrio aespoeensis Aspo-2]MBU4243488.1 DNA-binding protein [Pseudomonadota bacterium]MBU4473822.1 DNA-binding protein [Pseudomonadota bacterium]MBU4517298.1 DNA-binding protein [Pseudomonadota bacterium]